MSRQLLAILACIVVPSLAAATDGKPSRFWNLTGETVTHLYLAPAGTERWGADQCRNDPDGTVDFDERLRITGTAAGRYDVKLTQKSGRTAWCAMSKSSQVACSRSARRRWRIVAGSADRSHTIPLSVSARQPSSSSIESDMRLQQPERHPHAPGERHPAEIGAVELGFRKIVQRMDHGVLRAEAQVRIVRFPRSTGWFRRRSPAQLAQATGRTTPRSRSSSPSWSRDR